MVAGHNWMFSYGCFLAFYWIEYVATYFWKSFEPTKSEYQ